MDVNKWSKERLQVEINERIIQTRDYFKEANILLLMSGIIFFIIRKHFVVAYDGFIKYFGYFCFFAWFILLYFYFDTNKEIKELKEKL